MENVSPTTGEVPAFKYAKLAQEPSISNPKTPNPFRPTPSNVITLLQKCQVYTVKFTSKRRFEKYRSLAINSQLRGGVVVGRREIATCRHLLSYELNMGSEVMVYIGDDIYEGKVVYLQDENDIMIIRLDDPDIVLNFPVITGASIDQPIVIYGLYSYVAHQNRDLYYGYHMIQGSVASFRQPTEQIAFTAGCTNRMCQ